MAFTFHNVSINTGAVHEALRRKLLFTFHNVSINTTWKKRKKLNSYLFTFHNVSINTHPGELLPWQIRPLHSTMFLLIPLHLQMWGLFLLLFTFHNVSINTTPWMRKNTGARAFTFHNVSINTVMTAFRAGIRTTLHSTMFLLILQTDRLHVLKVLSLHSTMFLLIQGHYSK